MRLLLAEDERELSNAVAAVLRHNHYSVDTVYHGEDALDYGRSGNYDGVILDIMMPRRDGLQVLQKLREEGIETPVLLLTAKSQIEDRIAGLNAGADDYLPKPFDMGELLARVRAMTRRKVGYMPDLLCMGNLSLDRGTFTVMVDGGGSSRLGNKEFQILEMLLRYPGQLISADQFMERIWGYDAETENSVVWVYLSNLRKKLASLGADVELRAIRGVGYQLREKTKQ